jgi:hypothetical protein
MKQANHHTARIAAAKRASKQAKITQADAQAIRASSEPLKQVAARYGIAWGYASRIRRGEVRRDFDSPWSQL